MAQQQMSLFGPSAFDIQRQQAQQDQTNAVAQAQLTPFQSIRASALMSGTQAGRSLAGLFGIEDPALSEAKKMEELKAAVASQWDGNDPLEAYKIFAKEASARGLTQAAIGAATQIKAFEADREKTALGKRKAEAEITLAGARVGQAEAAAKASEAKASAAGQLKPSELGTLQAERDALRTRMQNSTSPLEQEELRQRIAEIDAVITTKTTAKDKTPPSVGQDREAIAQDMFDTDFYSLTQEQKKAVNKRADERAERLKSSPSLSVTLPKNLKSVGEVRQQFTTNVKPYITAANAAEQAEAMIDQASKGNFQGWRAAITQLAKSVGDSQISRAEIEAYGIDPSLIGSIVDRTSIFFSGTPSQDTINGAKKIATLVKKVNQDRAIQEQGTFLELAKQAEGYNPNTAPRFFELPFSPTIAVVNDQGVREGTTSSGTKYKLTIK
jgi:hypothetical protein